MNLLDNYEPSTGVAEKVTAEEIAENNLFLNAVLETDVMKVLTPTPYTSQALQLFLSEIMFGGLFLYNFR